MDKLIALKDFLFTVIFFQLRSIMLENNQNVQEGKSEKCLLVKTAKAYCRKSNLGGNFRSALFRW